LVWLRKKQAEPIVPVQEPIKVVRTEPIRQEIRELPRQEPIKPETRQIPQKERWMVVKELPLQSIREARDEDGTVVHLITLEEAITNLLNE
jgi:hypothetical protein